MGQEGGGASGGSGGGNQGDGGTSPDIGAILAYINYRNLFGKDGDYTGNAGYYGDNTGPVGSRIPETSENLPQALIDVIMAYPERARGVSALRNQKKVDPYGRTPMPMGSLHPFVGAEVDVFSGQPWENDEPDAFSGLPRADPYAGARQDTSRRSRLLASPFLLAENDVAVCHPGIMTCRPQEVRKSEFNQSSLANRIIAENDYYYAAVLDAKPVVAPSPDVDIHELATRAVEATQSDEYRLASAVNQLRSHPLEVRRSAVMTGLGHMASGAFVATTSGAIIYGSGGLALPLIGGMGFAAGIAEMGSGLALAMSGADSVETLRMSGQLDYAFALTSSPTKLLFGTTGLVLSGGDAEVSHRFAIVGGIAEYMASARGDPSKLYSTVVPGTHAQSGTVVSLARSSNVLREGKRLAIVNPHFKPTLSPEQAFQGTQKLIVSRFARNPASVGNYLKPGEMQGLLDSQAYARMGDWGDLELQAPTLFGKAVERALASSGQRTGLLDPIGQLRGAGGRFVSSPDFRGLGPYQGMFFESTTNSALPAHLVKGYPTTTVYATFDIPVTWYFFLIP